MASQAASSAALELLRCGVGRATFGLDLAHVRTIVRADQLRRRGGREDEGLVGHIAGANGEVPVYCPRGRLGETDAVPSSGQQIVVLHDQRATWGLLVERVSQIQRVPANALLPLPALGADFARAPFRGVLQADRELLLVLDPARWGPAADACAPGPAAASRPNTAFGSVLQPGGSRQLVLFSTSLPSQGQRPLWFGLSIAQVQEVLEPLPWTSVPGVPRYVHGLIGWRDRPVAVLDLNERLGLPASRAGEAQRMLVVQAGTSGALLAFPVAAALRLLRLPVPHRARPELLSLEPSLVRGVVELMDGTLVIPDLDAFVRVSGAGQ
ncbi:MAG: chemotaxis protein CheW [Planctomycetia bacterium]|nr:chemotaxis protein CheW [Planctomycetia bacterium]